MEEISTKDTLISISNYIASRTKQNIETKEERLQFNTLPEASLELLGNVYQYTGIDTNNYRHGYYYECVAKETDPITYEWQETRVSEAKEERLSTEITKVRVKYDPTKPNRFASYFIVDLVDLLTKGGHSINADDVKYCKGLLDDGRITQAEFIEVYDAWAAPFATASFDVIKDMIDLYYDGTLSLANIKSKWSIGDTKTIALSAMEATGVSETHAAQNVTLYIVDFNHDNLNTAIGSKTKSLMTLGFMIAENGAMNTSKSSSGGWEKMTRRTWCNNVCKAALPSELRNMIKPIVKSYTSVTTDSVFIPSSMEFTNSTSFVKRGDDITSKSSGNDDGVQYALYKNGGYTFSKAVITATTCNWAYSGGYSHNGECFIERAANGTRYWQWANSASGLMPHFCI